MKQISCTLLIVVMFSSLGVAQNKGMRASSANPIEKRIALVIGNAKYSDSRLRNPENDAREVTNALSETGFEVLSYTNLNQKEMKKAIRAFGQKLIPGGVSLFYYSGHGIQITGNNYLIPIGADIQKEGDVELEAVDANYVLNEMDAAKSRLNIVILDACRDNPLPRTFRSSTKGLAQMNAPVGTVIAFATSPGSVASDGKGKNGLFTQELIKNIRTPGVPIETIFKRTLKGVKDLSNGNQIPWTSYSIDGDFFFIPTTESTLTNSSKPAGTEVKETTPSSKDLPTDGLVAYYPFSGNANDQSGNGHTGILYGATLTTDRFGNPNSAYKFNGIDEYMSATLNELKNADCWTISLWVNADELKGGGPFSLLTSTPGYRADGFWWHFFPDGNVRYRTYDISAGLQLFNQASVPIETQVWQHHVVVIGKNKVVHYLNGGKVITWNTIFNPLRLDSNNLELRIGEGYNFEYCYPLSASIDDIYVFSRQLTESEIQKLYTDTK